MPEKMASVEPERVKAMEGAAPDDVVEPPPPPPPQATSKQRLPAINRWRGQRMIWLVRALNDLKDMSVQSKTLCGLKLAPYTDVSTSVLNT